MMKVLVVGEDPLARSLVDALEREGMLAQLVGPEALGPCDCLVVATPDDAQNLEVALEARHHDPHLPLVLRLAKPGLLKGNPLPHCQVLNPAEVAAPVFVWAVQSSRPVRPVPERPVTRYTPTDLFFWGALAAMVILAGLGTLYFHLVDHLPLMDAAYFVVTILATVGFGDYSLKDSSEVSKLVGMVLMACGVVTSAILFALVAQIVLNRREAFLSGQRRWGIRDHVVVCGSGSVGRQIVKALLAAGEKVAVVERKVHPELHELAALHGFPLIVADATLEEALSFAHVEAAKCLIGATDSDRANLEIALDARDRHPRLPVVVRIFRPDLAEWVEKHFGVISLSTTRIAVPHFVTAVKSACGSAQLPLPLFADGLMDLPGSWDPAPLVVEEA